ncbi:MAG: glycoside-pentoside-hexuronide (GPH):cation symporter [Faecalicatena sp.]|uniref:MFS transporter n=1 Tax=Faecalicatena sp. TaxID=2005360 RepID=UPI00258FE799|nr:glycoside-pentoside-hexuronide (GPH):cation symporter [Faecalicatena sp.]MCI6465523.1 glycoside-pentoside-hexuronide (GPH):cation symporter [Faecalicatena sp.]MDY4669961.1 glycoside-pentoside-hexuronide (GPH):cation symporter [Oliverpabstia sp.]MDY5617355.1 glycoside-pentoside-hexuronide (GPH):cation symporter [Lachnospiraceae bacterium]
MGKKKELGVDRMGVQKSMRKIDYFGDGLGQIPLNIMSGLVGQLTYFYTEKVGLAAGMIGTMLLVAKLFDAVTDLIMGKIMDAGHSPKGKCRPWFLRMAIPTLVMIVMMFTVPKNAGTGFQMGYILVTNILLSAVIYTAIAIPYGALMAVRTASSEERGKMGTFRAAFGYIAGMFIAILLVPVTNMLGGDQAAWIKLAVILAVISFVSLLVLYKVTKENVTKDNVTVEATEKDENTKTEAEKEEDVSFAEGLKLLFKNKYWVLMLIANMLMSISYALSGSGGTYYAKYILGNDNLVALLGAVGLIPTFLGFILVGPLAGKFGMTKTTLGCAALGAAACVVRAFTPYSIISCILGGAVTTFATIPMMCLFGAMVNNCVEYNEWKFGKRMVGMTNSASSFGTKVSGGIGGSLIGWLLGAAGYNAALAVQPKVVDTAIFAFSIYIPLALFIGLIILLRMYDLEKKYPEIMADLQARRAEKKAEEQ